MLISNLRLVGQLLARRLSSHGAVYDALIAVTEQRLEEKSLEKLGRKVEKHVHKIMLRAETSR